MCVVVFILFDFYFSFSVAVPAAAVLVAFIFEWIELSASNCMCIKIKLRTDCALVFFGTKWVADGWPICRQQQSWKCDCDRVTHSIRIYKLFIRNSCAGYTILNVDVELSVTHRLRHSAMQSNRSQMFSRHSKHNNKREDAQRRTYADRLELRIGRLCVSAIGRNESAQAPWNNEWDLIQWGEDAWLLKVNLNIEMDYRI